MSVRRRRAHAPPWRRGFFVVVVGLVCAAGGFALGRWWPARVERHPLVAPPARPSARLALIIDDCGYRKTTMPIFRAIRRPLTLSVLPHEPYSRAIVELGQAQQFEVMLHLPMEPEAGQVPLKELEPHTLTTRMPSEEVRRQIEDALASVPHVRGVNNHMGSKATRDATLMRAVLGDLKTRELYFVDSVVVADSVCPRVAREVSIRFGRRDVFLDNENRADTIKTQLRKLVTIAKQRGSAIGIGHDRPITLSVIAQMIPEIEAQGVRLVHVSDVVKQL